MMAVSDYDMSEYDVTVNTLTCVGSPCGDGLGGGGGDEVTVNTLGLTDADFTNSGRISWTRDTAPTPDQVLADIVANSVNATHIDETAAYTWTGASTHANATVDGVDAGASTTRSSEAKIKIASHNTNCTSLTDGVANETCYEEDSETFWICQPASGGCDTAAEWLPIGNTTKRVVDGTDFVGTVTCPSTITGGTQGDCMAIVTSYKGTTFVGGFLVMAGNYIATDPDNTAFYTGMQPLYAYFSPDQNFSADGMGGELDDFAVALKDLADDNFNGQMPRVVLAANAYLGDFDDPIIWRHGVLDACNSPRFFFSGNGDSTVTDEPETATIIGSSDPTNDDSVMLECPNCDFYGGDGDAYDGDEKTLPGNHICFDTTVPFTDPYKRCYRIRRIVDDDTIEFADPVEDGYSGTIQYANGAAFIIDEGITTGSGATETHLDPQIMCSERLTIECAGNCRSVDPYAATPSMHDITECEGNADPYPCCTADDVGATCDVDNRVVPMVGMMIRNSQTDASPILIGWDGKWGTGVAAMSMDGYDFTSTAGSFRGVIKSFGSSETAFQFGRTGYLPGTDDDGRHCSIYMGMPQYEVEMRGGDLHPNLICLAGINAGQLTINSMNSQNVQTRIWAPRGVQDLIYLAGAREETMKCGAGSFPPFAHDCEDEFQALYEIGPFSGDGSDDFFTTFNISDVGKVFVDGHIERTVFNFRGDHSGNQMVLDIGGSYEFFADLFEGSLSDDSVVRGDISFNPDPDFADTAPAPPGGDADLSGLTIRNDSGEVTWGHYRRTVSSGDFSTSSDSAYTQVTDLDFNIIPSTDYTVTCKLLTSAAAGTTGLQLQVTGPASPTEVTKTRNYHNNSAAAWTTTTQTAFDATNADDGATGSCSTSRCQTDVMVVIRNGSTGGTVELAIQSEVNGSAVTVYRGSYCDIQTF